MKAKEYLIISAIVLGSLLLYDILDRLFLDKTLDKLGESFENLTKEEE